MRAMLGPVIESLTFTVVGMPTTQGSMRKSRTGKIIHQSADKLEEWRLNVGWNARKVRPRGWSTAGGFAVELTCYLPRPLSLPAIVVLPIAHKNDVDKLARAVLDGLTGVLYDDDGQVVDLHVRKRFGSAHADIEVSHVIG